MGLDWDIKDLQLYAEKHPGLYTERGIEPPAPRRRAAVIQKDENNLPPDPYPGFAKAIVTAECLRPVREFLFVKEYGRGFSFDYAWPLHRLAVEIDGAVHRIRGRWESDLIKMNMALMMSYHVLHLKPAEVSDFDGGLGAQIVIRWLRHGPAAALKYYRKVIR